MATIPEILDQDYLDEAYPKMNEAIKQLNSGVSNLASGSVDMYKLRNMLWSILQDDTLEINLKDKKIYIKQTVYALNGTNWHSLSSSTQSELDITNYNTNTTYKLYMDASDSNKIKIVSLNIDTGNNPLLAFLFKENLVCANTNSIYLVTSTGERKARVFSEQFARVYQNNNINIDYENSKIVVSANTFLIGPNGFEYIPTGEYAIDNSTPSSYVKKLYYNRDTRTFGITEYTVKIQANIYLIVYWEGVGVSAKTFDPFENYKRVKIDGYDYASRNEGKITDTNEFDWNTNRFLLPNNLYLLKGIDYSIYAPNFNFNKFTDNDRLLFELISPTHVTSFENSCVISSPIAIDVETQLVGVYNGNLSNALGKNVTISFTDPSTKIKKDVKLLFIGDSITHANIAAYVKIWLTQFGFTPTFIGTVSNSNPNYGYGKVGGVEAELGEGRGGWRLTDFTGTTKRKDGTIYLKGNNPFWNFETNTFDFPGYMEKNSFDGVDFVIIMLGTNDILGHHNELDQENIAKPTIEEICEYMPIEYQKMIDSIHAYDPNIKIGINAPVLAGNNDSNFNPKQAKFTEELLYNFDGKQENVYCLGTYLTTGKLSGKNWGTIPRTPFSNKNDTYKSIVSGDVHDNGMNQMINALWSASWIINISE